MKDKKITIQIKEESLKKIMMFVTALKFSYQFQKDKGNMKEIINDLNIVSAELDVICNEIKK